MGSGKCQGWQQNFTITWVDFLYSLVDLVVTISLACFVRLVRNLAKSLGISILADRAGKHGRNHQGSPLQRQFRDSMDVLSHNDEEWTIPGNLPIIRAGATGICCPSLETRYSVIACGNWRVPKSDNTDSYGFERHQYPANQRHLNSSLKLPFGCNGQSARSLPKSTSIWVIIGKLVLLQDFLDDSRICLDIYSLWRAIRC